MKRERITRRESKLWQEIVREPEESVDTIPKRAHLRNGWSNIPNRSVYLSTNCP